MYDISTRKRALALVNQGRSLNSVSKETGISRAAIRSWKKRIEPLPRMRAQVEPCRRCQGAPALPESPEAYSYLLGLYLGDGCISAHPRTGHYLRVACADAWPGLMDACETAMRTVNPAGTAYRTQATGYVSVVSYSQHWPCLFPQHGPGKKHERTIALEPWQQAIVDAHPWEFIRGLIHSDGCRITNWTTRLVAGEQKRYEYTRYFFTNTSADIIRLFTDTLDSVGVEWKPLNQSRDAVTISIARKASVALMDAHVGPKY
ncbi:helix-turn-helix domain-containing protein [Streptomyces ipomoeae]|uniref:helix-turn-helix domain-containing protein n=1 Tax=Streptomyces ipomoeae TaxID=103232 RepID=UPI0011474505|nr:helix-turn-helix domain-containing protein [Streptomyces ipomoeae]MDX2930979.1 helix-turn-helix domain-containing protein [Streptomyces ipomoeae]TQE21659.1 helix-turn-helix domain-containing protein [Streptomyces ipomoeae]